MNEAFFIAVTAMDLTAAVIVFVGAFNDRMRLYPAWHKIGLIFAAIGLVAQAFRNVIFLTTGVSPSDSDHPLWVLKDAGIAVVSYTYVYVWIAGVVNKPKKKKFVHKEPILEKKIVRKKGLK